MDSSPEDPPASAEEAELIDQMKQLAERPCAGCGAHLCFHEILAARAFGASVSPRCASCLSAALVQSVPSLQVSLAAYLQARVCYRVAWDWATRNTSRSRGSVPCCALAGTRLA